MMATSKLGPKGSNRQTRRGLVAATIGNTLEWFDWNTYLSLVICFKLVPEPGVGDRVEDGLLIGGDGRPR
jgi:hypothetical protein